jgi:hypothetical protein
MKLIWKGSGTGAGYYVDLYETEDGQQVIIGSMREGDTIRKEVATAFNERPTPINPPPE